MINRYKIIIAGALLSTVFACSSDKGKNEAAKFLELNAEQLKSMDISLAPLEYKALQPVIFATGKVALAPNSDADVSSNIAGKIEKIHVIEGQKVRKGQVLITISSMELVELQQRYLSARNDAEFQRLEYERQQILQNKEIGALREFQETKSRYITAKNTVEGLKEKLLLTGLDISRLNNGENSRVVSQISICSPINGSVFKIHTTLGSSIETNKELVSVIDLTDLYADVDFYEKDLENIRVGQPAEIAFINKAIPKIGGTIQSIVRSIDPESKSVPVHINFRAPEGYSILPEMGVKVKVMGKKDDRKNLTVPLASLIQEGELFYMYYAVKKDNNYEFHRSKVNRKESDGTLVEIFPAQKLPENALVVASNVYLIDAETRKTGGE